MKLENFSLPLAQKPGAIHLIKPERPPTPNGHIMQQNSFGDTTERPAVDKSDILRLNDVKKTIWLTRQDLRTLCQGDLDRFEWWLLVNGWREYRALTEFKLQITSTRLAEPAPEAIEGSKPILSRLMACMWQMRPDLQSSFDLNKIDGQQSLMWWLITEGVRESDVLVPMAVASYRQLLSEPADCAIALVEPPLTGFMHLVWSKRPDLQEAFDLRTTDGQQRYVGWYFVHGLRELGFGNYLTDAQRHSLNEPDQRYSDDHVRITRLMVLVWQLRLDLQSEFSLSNVAGRSAFEQWFSTYAHTEIQLSDLIVTKANSVVCRPAESSKAEASAPEGLGAPAISVSDVKLTFGVNLVGYARGQFGIGEDVRMAAIAMRAANIPFSIYNIEPGKEVSQGDHSLNALIRDALPYSINLLCTTGIETARLAAVDGTRLFKDRFVIGNWPWELPEWPSEWHHAYDLVDEVWASTRYIYNAYIPSSTRPVRHMPMAVTTHESAGKIRKDFGLNERLFLFLFSFDMLSSLARKNPQACLQAFRCAFPRGDEPVGLVIKAIHTSKDNPVWGEFIAEAEADPRVTIIDGTLKRPAVLDLYRACDCFVSLHRAEGFGRGIAEAMMLGKPAIVTGFSGNLDFTTPSSAALVDYQLRSVLPDEYPFGGGQVWAEPDVNHAAWWMRRLVADAALRRRLAAQGRKLTTATYASLTVGTAYEAVLRSISRRRES